jgi:hypothetical protein
MWFDQKSGANNGHYFTLSKYIGHTLLIDVSAVRSMPYLISLVQLNNMKRKQTSDPSLCLWVGHVVKFTTDATTLQR